YQTLYAVLVTVTRLIAPVVPFIAESIYQNLVAKAGAPGAKESVHHEAYPVADNTLLDAQLSNDIDALLRIVSLGRASRNVVKVKVGQALAELKVQPGDDADRRAVDRFAAEICDELNIKNVTLHDGANGPLLRYEVKPNPKSLGPKFNQRLKDVSA